MNHQQILKLQEQYSDCLLFIRIGDFYEAFGQDAKTISTELDLTLTTRSMPDSKERMPMAGVPHHALNSYIEQLLGRGYKVAVAESVMDKVATKREPERKVCASLNKINIKEKRKLEQNVTPYTEEECASIVENSKEYFNAVLGKGDLKKVLCAIGRNGRFTLNNTLTMLSAVPELKIARNMADWADLGRSIIPDSSSIEIMSPIKEKRIVELKEGEEQEFDDNGKPIEKSYMATIGFKPTYVFDISHTIGKDYKPFALDRKVSDSDKKTILNGISYELKKHGYGIEFVDSSELGKQENGKVNRKERKVGIRKGMDNFSTLATLLKFSSSALIDAKRYANFDGIVGDEAREIEMSCIGCVLAEHFGLDTSKYDFSYTTAWNNEEKEQFYSNINLVCSTSTKLMESIARSFQYSLDASNEQGAEKDNPSLAKRPSLFRGVSKQSISEVF